jgi:hypothetical protein
LLDHFLAPVVVEPRLGDDFLAKTCFQQRILCSSYVKVNLQKEVRLEGTSYGFLKPWSWWHDRGGFQLVIYISNIIRRKYRETAYEWCSRFCFRKLLAHHPRTLIKGTRMPTHEPRWFHRCGKYIQTWEWVSLVRKRSLSEGQALTTTEKVNNNRILEDGAVHDTHNNHS